MRLRSSPACWTWHRSRQMADSEEQAWKAIDESMVRHEAATEEMLDDLEFGRFYDLFRWVPVDSYRPAGRGIG